jgi:aminopeptidase N
VSLAARKRWAALALALAFGPALSAAETVDVWSRPERRPPVRSYDARHYRIALRLDDETRSFRGETEVTLTPLLDGLRTIRLDAETFTVTAVRDPTGKTLPFVQKEGRLDIDLPRAASRSETIVVTVVYEDRNVRIDPVKFGMTADYPLGLGFRDETPDNPRLVETLSFPTGARHWFPCFDHPSDKATSEVLATVRNDWRVLSNGRLVETRDDPAAKTRTFHWRQDQPHSTYLFVLVAGPYEVLTDLHGAVPLGYWVYPKDVPDAPRSFRKTPEILRFFERTFGVPYPWVKYDQVTIPGIGGGAESTNATVLGQSTIHDEDAEPDFPSAWLVAHEAAHQWWGDLVTLADWSETWLNESFATYGEYLYSRFAAGDDEGAVNLLEKKDAYLKEAREKYVRPIVFDRWQWPNDNFDRHTYQKGALVLHMLRDLVGDEAFFKALRIFLERHAYGSVTTPELVAAFRETSGQDLEWFFDQWVRKPGHPVLEVSQAWDEASRTLSLRIRQVQDRERRVPIFRARVRIGILTQTGHTSETVWLGKEEDAFRFVLPSRPRLVRFDEGDVLLAEVTFPKAAADLVYQLAHDDARGRAWAAGELARLRAEPGVEAALVHAARADAFWKVREAAVDAMAVAPRPEDVAFFRERATDGGSKVRVAALRALSAFGSPSITTGPFLAERYREDLSYLVRAEAIRGLGRIRDPSFLPLVEEAARLRSPRQVVRTAALAAREQLEKCKTEEVPCVAR